MMQRGRAFWMGLAAASILLAGTAGPGAGAAPAEPAVLAPSEPPLPEVAGSRAPTDDERKAAIASIEGQLKAFRDDDWETAVRYLSSGLRRNFESLDQFREMIVRNYPQFARYRAVSFGEARCNESGERLAIRVLLTGQDGVTVRATYLMIREDGEYRVASVLGGIPGRPSSTRDIV